MESSETKGNRDAVPPVKVLVIDDEPDLLDLFQWELKGHDVTVAEDPREALNLILKAENRFDVIFCDLSLKGLSGIEVYRKVASESPGTERRFVFVTGGPSEKAAEFLASIQARVIDKPIDFSLVRNLLASPKNLA